MTAPDVDPILVAAEWLPRLPNGARGMVVTLCAALDRERRAHACTLAELERERARPRLRVAVDDVPGLSPPPEEPARQAEAEEPAP